MLGRAFEQKGAGKKEKQKEHTGTHDPKASARQQSCFAKHLCCMPGPRTGLFVGSHFHLLTANFGVGLQSSSSREPI